MVKLENKLSQYDKDLAKILARLAYHISPEIVKYIADRNKDDYEEFKKLFEGKINIDNYIFEGSDCVFPGVRRYVSGEGEMAGGPLIFSGAPNYPATLESIENGSVHFFETNQFKQFLKSNPDYQTQFTTQMMQFMHYLRNKTSSLMLLNLKERLMEYLHQNGAEHNFIQLKINKNQLALLLNATPESISRTFKALEEEDLIETKGETYKIKKPLT